MCLAHYPFIPFMANLWIRSGYDMKVEMSAQTYQVGAHFKAQNEPIIVAASKTFEEFFSHFDFPCRTVPSIDTPPINQIHLTPPLTKRDYSGALAIKVPFL